MTSAEAAQKSAYIQQMFSSIAPRYDLLNHLLSLNIDQYWRSKAVKLSAIRPDAQVLDVCCGTGDFSFEFAKVLNTQGRVVGTDFVTSMVEIFRQKIKKRNLSGNISAKFADALKLPFENASFDVLSVAFGVRNLADYQAGLNEFFRVLKPSGKLVILEFNDTDSRVFGPIFKFYFDHVLPLIGSLISNDKTGAYKYLPASVKAFPSQKEFTKMMMAAGFTPCMAHPMTFGIASCFIGIKS